MRLLDFKRCQQELSMIKLIALVLFLTTWLPNSVVAQNNVQMHRIANLKIDERYLDKYKSALEEQMNAAIRLEPGVLSYTAVGHKNDSTRITIFEVYANTAAYQSHIATTHFKKYKETVKDWVLSLELIDTVMLLQAKKRVCEGVKGENIDDLQLNYK